MKFRVLVLLACSATALVSNAARATQDHFDRDALGNKWVVPSGSLFISKGELQGTDMAVGYDKKSAGDTTVRTTVILHGANLEYGAVTSGDVATGNYAFVKIQSAGGKFGYGAFYTGNNGVGTFFELASPVSSPATLTVSICGTVATMKIESADGRQKYKHDYGTNFGTGGGLGTYGPVSLDDYRSKPGGCSDLMEEERGAGAHVIRSSNAIDLSK